MADRAAPTKPDLSADEIIRRLKLQPHPEGGHFRETFRDSVAPGGRAASTAIYFLLKAGERSRWHRVDAAEVWHHYAGDALELQRQHASGHIETLILGHDLSNGQEPQAVIAAGQWQRARSLGAWSLLGCTVAPGFSFDGFELAADDELPAIASD